MAGKIYEEKRTLKMKICDLFGLSVCGRWMDLTLARHRIENNFKEA